LTELSGTDIILDVHKKCECHKIFSQSISTCLHITYVC